MTVLSTSNENRFLVNLDQVDWESTAEISGNSKNWIHFLSEEYQAVDKKINSNCFVSTALSKHYLQVTLRKDFMKISRSGLN